MRQRFHTTIRPGDPAAASGAAEDAPPLGELLQTYWPALVAYALRLLDDGAAAEDVVQRAFVRLWERGHVVPGGGATRPYLYRVVRNLAANEWRRRETQRHWEDEESLVAPTAEDPGTALEGRELEAALGRAVERLPARRREIFVLSRYHGLTNPQIGEVLGVSTQTVANQLVSALRTLRTTLGPHLDGGAYPPLQIVRGRDRPAG